MYSRTFQIMEKEEIKSERERRIPCFLRYSFSSETILFGRKDASDLNVSL